MFHKTRLIDTLIALQSPCLPPARRRKWQRTCGPRCRRPSAHRR